MHGASLRREKADRAFFIVKRYGPKACEKGVPKDHVVTSVRVHVGPCLARHCVTLPYAVAHDLGAPHKHQACCTNGELSAADHKAHAQSF